MSDLDKNLRSAFGQATPDPERYEVLKEEVMAMYEQRMSWVTAIAWVGHVLLGLLLIGGMLMLLNGTGGRDTVFGAVLFLLGNTGLVLMKLWYWVLQTKYSVLSEMKAIQTQVAELAERLPAGN